MLTICFTLNIDLLSFLIDTLEQIEKNIAVEGLFRKPGSAARLKELRVGRATLLFHTLIYIICVVYWLIAHVMLMFACFAASY